MKFIIKFIVTIFLLLTLTSCVEYMVYQQITKPKDVVADINLDLLTIESEEEFFQNKHIKSFNDSVKSFNFTVGVNINTAKERLDSCHDVNQMTEDYKRFLGLYENTKNTIRIINYRNIKYVMIWQGMFGSSIVYGYNLKEIGNTTQVSLFSKYTKSGFFLDDFKKSNVGKMTLEQMTNWMQGRIDKTIFKTNCRPR